MALKLIYNRNLERIIDGCRKNERASQKRLYDLYGSKMLAVCIRYMKQKEEAEDVLQEGFVKIFSKIDSYSGKGSFEGWMRMILVNVALRHLEQRKRKPETADVELTELYTESLVVGEGRLLEYGELLNLVASLPEGYRVVFNLYALEGYTHKEIAEKLKISEGTSKSQLARARAKLKEQLEVLHSYGLKESEQTAG